MELRQYAQILYRRWWIPVALVILTGLFSAIQLRPWQTPAPTYTASLRVLIGVAPATAADAAAYDPRYYAWLTSEYLVDDFTQVVRSDLFAQKVSERLADQGIQRARRGHPGQRGHGPTPPHHHPEPELAGPGPTGRHRPGRRG